MIKLEHTQVFGWDAAVRGMRNPLNSWHLSDSYWTHIEDPETLETAPFQFFLGAADRQLMQKLVQAGPDHRKFLRMIHVQVDVTAPLYWWKEADTYKVGTVANSCSTMHTIHLKSFDAEDFSLEHLSEINLNSMEHIIGALNIARAEFLADKNKDKDKWWQMIQLLPTSYNQKRTLDLNYETLLVMHHARRNHKLDEWHTFCDWIADLPYFKAITEYDWI